MASKSKMARIVIRLRSTESPYTYTTTKNKQKHPERMELKKYDPILRKHVLFREAK
jgi:large subunit ribosomal protein L33